jgi:hypothetical protein
MIDPLGSGVKPAAHYGGKRPSLLTAKGYADYF